MITDNRERMEAGLLYNPMDPEIMSDQLDYVAVVNEYNNTHPKDSEGRQALLRKMFAEIGEGCYIEPPIHANWGCKHVHFGKEVYANFNLTLVDDGEIYVGDNVMFAPNVTVITATHPVLPELREQGLQFNADVHIGKNVWIGAGAMILPGLTIGDGSVIGAGSVVTKDVPPNVVVVVGNPARILREIGERDRVYYHRDKKIDFPLKSE